MNDLMVHIAATLRLQSTRLPLTLEEIHGFEICIYDFRQAYIQSVEPLLRD